MPTHCVQEAKLRAAWDDHGGAPGGTAAIAAELGWKKGAVGRHLKALGLKRGVLTVTQVHPGHKLATQTSGQQSRSVSGIQSAGKLEIRVSWAGSRAP